MISKDFDDRVSRVAALAEPVRRALYRFVVAQPAPVSREEAAAGVGVAHHAAKFHLDKLEEDGLLEVELRRPHGRSGPGAGRPAKHYKRAAREIEVSIPERRYDLAGQVMAQAIATAQSTGAAVGTALQAAAKEAGRSLGVQARNAAGGRRSRASQVRAVCDVLAERGYEPRQDGSTVTMANCPFHALAKSHRELVCGMNLDLVEGLLHGFGSTALRARLEPEEGRCCVTVGPA